MRRRWGTGRSQSSFDLLAARDRFGDASITWVAGSGEAAARRAAGRLW